MQRYQKLAEEISLSASGEERKEILKYIYAEYIGRGMVCLALAAGIWLLFYGGMAVWLAVFAVLAGEGVYRLAKNRLEVKLRNTLIEECRPDKVLGYYAVAGKWAWSRRTWDKYFFNIANNLFYLGEFRKTEKVLEIFRGYAVRDSAKYYLALMDVRMDFHMGNEEKVIQECSVLRKLSPCVKADAITKYLHAEAQTYPGTLELIGKQDYTELFNAAQKSRTFYNSELGRIKKTYLLFLAAKGMGDQEEAERQRNVIMEKGGTLWYRQVVSGKAEDRRITPSER